MSKLPSNITPDELKKQFNREYFVWDGTGQAKGYRGTYADFPENLKFLEYIKSLNPESVLEAGCSYGFLTKRLNDAGIPAEGFDVSSFAIKMRVTDKIRQASVLDLSCYKDKQFDLVVTIELLEHIPEAYTEQALRELSRVSKRGVHWIAYKEVNDLFQTKDITHINIKNFVWWKEKVLAICGSTHEVVHKEKDWYPKPVAIPKGGLKRGLNVGSFVNCLLNTADATWLNIDVLDLEAYAKAYGYNFQRMDARKISFPDNSFDYIVASHFLEHLTPEEGKNFLLDCHRILKTDGVIRLSVPDAELLIKKYRSKELGYFDEINPECEKAKMQLGKLNALLWGGHKSTYDSESITQLLEETGFKTSIQSFNQSQRPDLMKQIFDYHPDLSLYVEATPIKKEAITEGSSSSSDRDKLKIALISTPFLKSKPDHYGGLETVVADLAAGLSEMGHDVTLFAAKGSKSIGNYQVYETIDPVLKYGTDWGKVNWYEMENQAYEIYKDKLEDFDIIHSHNWFHFPYMAKMKNPHLKVCATHHGGLGFKTKPCEKMNLIAISKFMADSYARQLNTHVHWCLSPDTRILTSQGYSVPIKELVEKRMSIDLIGFSNGQIVHSKITDFQKLPCYDEILLIKTKSIQIKSTSDHKFSTPSGWIPAKNLCIGDQLYVIVRINGKEALEERRSNFPQRELQETKSSRVVREIKSNDTLCPTQSLQNGISEISYAISSVDSRRNRYFERGLEYLFKGGVDRKATTTYDTFHRNEVPKTRIKKDDSSSNSKQIISTISLRRMGERVFSRFSRWRGTHNNLKDIKNWLYESYIWYSQQFSRDTIIYPQEVGYLPYFRRTRGAARSNSRSINTAEATYNAFCNPRITRLAPLGSIGTISSGKEEGSTVGNSILSFEAESELERTLQPRVIQDREGSKSYKLKSERINSIERVNLIPYVYDLTTTTHNFFANSILVHNCYNGIDLNAYPFKKDKGERLCFVGRFVSFKQPHIAIEVAKKLNMGLDLVGGAYEEPYFSQYVKPYCDGKQIVLHTEVPHEEKVRLLQNAKALLFPSKMNEPFGLCLVEANSCGTPVIGSRDGAIPELLHDGINGFVCDDLEGMVEVIKSGKIDDIKPENCRSIVEQNFTKEIMAKKYLELFKKILAGDEW